VRILVTGGGTGGHVYPALAVLEHVQRKVIDSGGDPPQILWVGTDRKEAQILPKYGIELVKVDIVPFRRSLSIRSVSGNLRLAVNLITRKAEKQAIKHLKGFQPDLVLSTGGYVAYPACQAALKCGVPLYQIEPNATPGLVTDRIASRATMTFCSTKECALALKNAKRKIVGIPVRSYTGELNKNQILEKYKLQPDRRLILVTGGSLGSKFLNKLVFGTLVEIIDAYGNLRENTQIIHQVGSSEIKVAQSLAKVLSFRYVPVEYFEEMPEILSIADMLISRSGAGSVAEAVHFGIPALFFPYVHHSDRQQVTNVLPLVESRVAEMYIETEFDEAVFRNDFLELLNACTNPALRARIKEFDCNGADAIANNILNDCYMHKSLNGKECNV
jgi:UDP-N-acetylglucosamine--N-acetylmuramyl-(pentapeptide) pyrophosphoryl-undecaprenol N-acetylglucosamine transferase